MERTASTGDDRILKIDANLITTHMVSRKVSETSETFNRNLWINLFSVLFFKKAGETRVIHMVLAFSRGAVLY